MSEPMKKETKMALAFGLIISIAVIVAFAAGVANGEQKTEEKYSLLLFEVTKFADHQQVETANHKMRMDTATIQFDLSDPAYAEDNITMIGIRVHPYPEELLEQEKAKKIANQIAEAADGEES